MPSRPITNQYGLSWRRGSPTRPAVLCGLEVLPHVKSPSMTNYELPPATATPCCKVVAVNDDNSLSHWEHRRHRRPLLRQCPADDTTAVLPATTYRYLTFLHLPFSSISPRGISVVDSTLLPGCAPPPDRRAVLILSHQSQGPPSCQQHKRWRRCMSTARLSSCPI